MRVSIGEDVPVISAQSLDDLEAVFLACSEFGLRAHRFTRRRFWKVAHLAAAAIIRFDREGLSEFRFPDAAAGSAIEALSWYERCVQPDEDIMPPKFDEVARQAGALIHAALS